MRIQLTVAYDGTAFHGWQIQPGNVRTVEGELNKALSALTGEDISVIGASRTDAGVHAYGNIAVFDTGSTIPEAGFLKALNGRLPWDIRIMDAKRVADDFHPRHTDTAKTYCYHVYHGDILPPEDRLYNFHIYGPLDIEEMRRATGAFIGEHDFAGFCAVGNQTETTVRTIYSLQIEARKDTKNTISPMGEYVEIRISGSGFLYNMVRIIAGTLIEVGRGRMCADDIPAVIASCDRSKAGPTLPPMGLVLEKYEFLQKDDLRLLSAKNKGKSLDTGLS